MRENFRLNRENLRDIVAERKVGLNIVMNCNYDQPATTLSLKDIETIQELNAELDKMSDEAKQCIAELEWFIQKYPENVVLKELEPIIADLEELRKTNNGIDVQEQDQDQDQDQEQVQEQEQVCVQE